jgi:hypothetical protein
MRTMSSRFSNLLIVLKKCSRSRLGNISLVMNPPKPIFVCTSPSFASIPFTSNTLNAISGLSDISISRMYAVNGSYPKLNAWLKHLYYEVPGFKETTNFMHIKHHYMMSHPTVSCLLNLLTTDQSTWNCMRGTCTRYRATVGRSRDI